MFVAMDIEAAVIKAGHKVVGFAGTAERAVTLADEMRPDLVLDGYPLAGRCATASTQPSRSGSVSTSPRS